MPVDKVRRLINAIDDHKTEFSSPPFISKKLRELLKVSEPINEKKSMDELQQKIENKNEQTMDKFKQTNEQTMDKLKQINEQTMDKLKQIKDELKAQLRGEFKQQMRDELKQTKNELMKDMQELLN